jgi:hypothetical protein
MEVINVLNLTTGSVSFWNEATLNKMNELFPVDYVAKGDFVYVLDGYYNQSENKFKIEEIHSGKVRLDNGRFTQSAYLVKATL